MFNIYRYIQSYVFNLKCVHIHYTPLTVSSLFKMAIHSFKKNLHYLPVDYMYIWTYRDSLRTTPGLLF